MIKPLRYATLRQKMTALLLLIVMQSVLFTGIIMMIGNLYLQRFNTVMNDCYNINGLLAAYNAEMAFYRTYVEYGGEKVYSEYLNCRSRSNRALKEATFDETQSQKQRMLYQSVAETFESYRSICDEVVLKRIAGTDYADNYSRSLRVGESIDSYIKSLLQFTIGMGQDIYQRNRAQFSMLPVLFLISLGLSLISIALWTRWMVKRVVSPINALIRVTGAMSENQYDQPDIIVSEEADDEIAQLTIVVNQMKHSTARLVDSLQVQRDMEQKLHAEEVRRMTIETTMDTLRLSLLQSQINPHFLFNTLNIISRMAQMEDSPKTEELILRLSNLFRYNLRSVDDVVPLANEVKIVEDYIAIQQIRFGERIRFELCFEVEPEGYTVPVFTLQPLIENAVIHGISPMEEGGAVTVCIRTEAENLVITVRDTGVGMSPEKMDELMRGEGQDRKHVTGLGLGNVRSRIQAHYPGSTFEITSELGTGTKIHIAIPLEEVSRDV